jgi:hypothetical protein
MNAWPAFLHTAMNLWQLMDNGKGCVLLPLRLQPQLRPLEVVADLRQDRQDVERAVRLASRESE